MKHPGYFFLPLLAALVLSACSPAMPAASATAEPAALISPTTAGQSQPVPQATSRGDKLEASAPASVKYGAGRPVLVEFFRFTWTTCQQMAPMVHGLEAKYSGRINFFFLDADDTATQDYQQKFGFQYQPYFILLDGGGKEVKRWAGSVDQGEFETVFADILK